MRPTRSSPRRVREDEEQLEHDRQDFAAAAAKCREVAEAVREDWDDESGESLLPAR